MQIGRKQKIAVAVLTILATISTATFVYAVIFSGSYSQTVTNTVPAAPAYKISAASDSLGNTCTFSNTVASCPAASLSGVGQTYTISITISNTGTVAGTISTSATTTSGGTVDGISPSTNSQSINPASTFTFVYTITENGAGSDTVNITFSG